MWMAYIYQDAGEEGLTELLDMLSDPKPGFIDDILMGLFGTAIEHDRKQMRENILPAIVGNFAQTPENLRIWASLRPPMF